MLLIAVMVFVYSNKCEARSRRLLDALPHDTRRYLYMKLRPRVMAELMAMRRPDGADAHFDLSSFERRKSIFFHVPKAAGRSVRKCLFDGRTASHTTVHWYKLAFSAREYRQYFKFAFVRNPWDRVYSAYTYLEAGGAHAGDALVFQRHLSLFRGFEDFVLNGLARTVVDSAIVHLLPAVHFLELRPGRGLDLDFVGYFETFPDDLRYAAARMGVALDDIPHENPTRGKTANYLDVYSDEMRAVVSQVYARDCAVFGYTFDSFSPIRLNAKG